MAAVVIKTVNLTKRYGTLVALSNLNLEISEGDCFGFIGPNGAGKQRPSKFSPLFSSRPGEKHESATMLSAINPDPSAH